jgi:glycosyltransferase involved in cell wall biosynthesis
MHGVDPGVAVVIWTYGRAAVAAECVRAVLEQTLVPQRVVVVDSASPDGTADRLRAEFPTVEVVRLDANEGMGAAIAEGLTRVLGGPEELVWFVEDDAVPAPDTLARLAQHLTTHHEVEVVGPRGARLRRGRWDWLAASHVGPCDFCMLDGALARAAVLRGVEPPRRDFFIMHVDVEYPLRLRRAGARSFQLGTVQHGARQLGAASRSTEWRAYYQTRNHVRIALEWRSPAMWWGFAVRTLAQVTADVVAGRRGWRRIGFRARGLVDGLRGRMGQTVQPTG